MEPKKLAPLRILQILQIHSDANHPLKQEQIAEHLEKDYGIIMERKAIGRNVTELKAAGFDIRSGRAGSYLPCREFEDAELHLLIDSVLQSKHITAEQSKDLIERLCGLGSKFFRSHVKNIYSVGEWSKTENPATFLNIEVIDEALAAGKQVQYDYNKYGIDGKLHKTRTHRITPYQLILHNQRYYVMGYNPFWRNMVFHRIDRITGIKQIDTPAVPLQSIEGYENGIDYERLATAMPYMYHDTPERIEFIADAAIVDQIVDWFGPKARMSVLPDNEEKVCVSLLASPKAMAHWATQYVNHVVVTKPEHLRQTIKASLEKALQAY